MSNGIQHTLERLNTRYPACGFVSVAPAERWDAGTVVGNGIQGVLSFGRTSDEELVLSHEELFLPLFPEHGYLPVKEHYETVRRLVLKGNAREAQELLLAIKEEGSFGSAMAFGFTQLGSAAAYLGDTDLAYESIEYLVNSYWSPAMVSQHDPHDTMNLDISGGLPAVVITMLVQSFMPDRPGGGWIIRLLPVLPAAWPTGSLRGVRCRGGFEVAVSWDRGVLQRADVKSLRGEPCVVHYGGRSVPLQLQAGDCCSLSAQLEQKRDPPAVGPIGESV